MQVADKTKDVEGTANSWVDEARQMTRLRTIALLHLFLRTRNLHDIAMSTRVMFAQTALLPTRFHRP